MKYENLQKIHYKTPEKESSIYQKRFKNEFSKHFDISIKQYHRCLSYPAFLCYTEEMFQIQEKVYKNYEEFLSLLRSVPHVVLEQFSLLSIVDEVKSTNDIEGVKSTRREIESILDEIVPCSARLTGVVNKYKNLLSDEEIPFNESLDIRKFYDDFLHIAIMTDDSSNRLDGVIFRKDSVDIANATGKTIHQGLMPETKIIETMNKALKILNDTHIPVLIRISLFHYFFAYIHPFYDGNGRTDRFITAYYLGKHFHPLVALRLSYTLKRQQKKYYKLFELTDSELNRGDMTPFVIGFLYMIAESFSDSVHLLKRKKLQLEKYAAKIDSMLPKDELVGEIYFILLQAALFYGKGITIQQIEALTHKARATIQKRLDNMPKDHILKEKIKTKYFYKLNLLMLKDDK